MKRTTLKPKMLEYRSVGSSDTYTKLPGLLKGLTVTQDDPDSTEIEAEFFDSPWDIQFDGNPIVIEFDLVNFDFDELPDLIGGSNTAATSTAADVFEGPVSAFSSEWEWLLTFYRGNNALKIYDGITTATLNKDEDGALRYHFKITSKIYTDSNEVDHMYSIVGQKTSGE